MTEETQVTEETKTEQPEEIRELRKLSENEFELYIENTKHRNVNIKKYTKQELRDIYEEIDGQRTSLVHAVKKLNKQLEGLDVEDTEELRELEDKLHKIQQLQQKRQLQGQKEQNMGKIDLLAGQAREISLKIPEVLRNAENK